MVWEAKNVNLFEILIEFFSDRHDRHLNMWRNLCAGKKSEFEKKKSFKEFLMKSMTLTLQWVIATLTGIEFFRFEKDQVSPDSRL